MQNLKSSQFILVWMLDFNVLDIFFSIETTLIELIKLDNLLVIIAKSVHLFCNTFACSLSRILMFVVSLKMVRVAGKAHCIVIQGSVAARHYATITIFTPGRAPWIFNDPGISAIGLLFPAYDFNNVRTVVFKWILCPVVWAFWVGQKVCVGRQLRYNGTIRN